MSLEITAYATIIAFVAISAFILLTPLFVAYRTRAKYTEIDKRTSIGSNIKEPTDVAAENIARILKLIS